MCGIAGYVERGHANAEPIWRQLAQLRHRGPDAEGAFVGDRAVIGQARLAIIDLAAGNPPIQTPDGTIAVVLNGEVYNFDEIRTTLLEQGHHFGSRCDTEVIAHLAEGLPPVALAASLHGMFAAAVWDERQQTLSLLRDRLGKKPLYWWRSDRMFVFASEIKALLAHPSVPASLDNEAIAPYLTFGYVPTPKTFYEGINSVPPGHVLVVDANLNTTTTCYWKPTAPGIDGTERLPLSLPEAARELRTRLSAAVRRRLISDVPVGAFLSGGVDSSAIVALMAEHLDRPVRTFTIGFEDTAGFDERPYAARVAEHLGTEHSEFVVQPNAIDLLERLVWHHDQPFGDSSAVPTYLLAEITRSGVTVALSGDGGDELFAGYRRLAVGAMAAKARAVPGLLPAASVLLRLLPAVRRVSFARALLAREAQPSQHAFRQWVSYVPDEQREALCGSDWHWGLSDYDRIWKSSSGAHPLDRLTLLTISTYLLDDLLPKVDRMAMAHGLEVRSPFLDHDLVEFALRLPPSTRHRFFSLKRVLKHSMADLLPKETLERGKRGFGIPLDRWFRVELAAYTAAMLGNNEARVRSCLDGAAVDRLLEEHRRGSANHGHALWTLTTLEVFLRKMCWDP